MHKRFLKEWRKYSIVRISVVLRTQKATDLIVGVGVWWKRTQAAQLSRSSRIKIKKRFYETYNSRMYFRI